jgi:hypothetical protein
MESSRGRGGYGAVRQERLAKGEGTVGDVLYANYKNVSKAERSKYLSDCTFTIDHSDTSSECSFDKDPMPVIKKVDSNYNVRIERLFPKHLRRIRFHEISERKALDREEYLREVEKNPKEYSSRKGLREFLVMVKKRKEADAVTKTAAVTKRIMLDHPWLCILKPADCLLDTPDRERAITVAYYEIINGMSDEELVNSPDKLTFIRWYNARKNKIIVEPEFPRDTFTIETKGTIAKLVMNKSTKRGRSSRTPAKHPQSTSDSDESSS